MKEFFKSVGDAIANPHIARLILAVLGIITILRIGFTTLDRIDEQYATKGEAVE